jgi:GNAT superfamily N-acetyltransferase
VGEVSPPARLSTAHDCAQFDSGSPQLDNWLRDRALSNEREGATRTYVVCEGARVVAFYSLATGAIAHKKAPSKLKRNMPDPIPVIVLARLAVDREFQRRGLGKGLLRDAILRTLQAAEIAGIRAILVHAKNESVRRYYERFGFIVSPTDPLTIMLSLRDASAQLTQSVILLDEHRRWE